MTNSKEKKNKIDFLGKYHPKSLYDDEKIKEIIKDLTPTQQEEFLKSMLEKKERKSENPFKKIFNFIFKK